MGKFEDTEKETMAFREKKEKLYLAYLEEQCHIHPTAKVEFESDYDPDADIYLTYVRIGGFDSGIKITDADILNWLIDEDLKISEIKDYKIINSAYEETKLELDCKPHYIQEESEENLIDADDWK